MKKMIIILFGLLLLAGCTGQAGTQENSGPDGSLPYDYKYDYKILTFQVGPHSGLSGAEISEIDIRVLDGIIDPDEIKVRQGSIVRLFIYAMDDLKISDRGHDNATHEEGQNEKEQKIRKLISRGNTPSFRDIRFIIDEYGIDELLREGGPAVVEFVADRKGTFTYGDDSHNQPKGVLIVG